MFSVSGSTRSHARASRTSIVLVSIAAASCLPIGGLGAQTRAATATAVIRLSLDSAKSLARSASPEIRAAEEAVRGAQARASQAQSFPNPAFSYGREQTSNGALRNSQDIAQIEQPIEIGGQRNARKIAADARAKVAESRRESVRRKVDFEVTQAYHRLASAIRSAALLDSAVEIFREAERVSAERLAAGDESGYATRRLRLETARYASQRAEVALALRSARIDLASQIGAPSARIEVDELKPASALNELLVDSLVMLALQRREELKVAEFEVIAMNADARLVRAERVPTPTLSAGYKAENVRDGGASGADRLNGFVAGVSIPLPLFDRKGSAIEAASADSRRMTAELEKLRREIDLDVRRAYESLLATDEQIRLLQPHLGSESTAALRAVQVSYAEGEITLVEWLDAVRAYQESEITQISLQTEAAIRRAALERAVGTSLFVR